MESSNSTWDSRIHAARRGDRDAIDELFQGLRTYLRRRAEQQLSVDLGIKVSPSDIVQDTFLRAFESFPEFRGSTRGELIAWVQSILRHRVLSANRSFRGTEKRNLARERQDQSHLPTPQSTPANTETPSQVMMAHEELQRLECALRMLRPRQELAIRLRNELHLSFEEVGSALNCTEDAAQKLWGRAVKRLATILKITGGPP